MIKISNTGMEDSGVSDVATGRRIYVTVTARKKFREANPQFTKVRNALLNTAMANDFSKAKVQPKFFKVRKDPHARGQVRTGAGGEYIAIIDSNSIKIVGFGRAGVPRLTGLVAPQVRTPASVSFGDTPSPVSFGDTPSPVSFGKTPAPVALSNTEFSYFLIKHSFDNLCATNNLHEERLHTVVDLLSENTGLPIDEILRKLETVEDPSTLYELCSNDQADYLKIPEDKNSYITDPVYSTQSSLPSSALAIQTSISNR
jgi:hypothetical protein